MIVECKCIIDKFSKQSCQKEKKLHKKVILKKKESKCLVVLYEKMKDFQFIFILINNNGCLCGD